MFGYHTTLKMELTAAQLNNELVMKLREREIFFSDLEAKLEQHSSNKEVTCGWSTNNSPRREMPEEKLFGITKIDDFRAKAAKEADQDREVIREESVHCRKHFAENQRFRPEVL